MQQQRSIFYGLLTDSDFHHTIAFRKRSKGQIPKVLLLGFNDLHGDFISGSVDGVGSDLFWVEDVQGFELECDGFLRLALARVGSLDTSNCCADELLVLKQH